MWYAISYWVSYCRSKKKTCYQNPVSGILRSHFEVYRTTAVVKITHTSTYRPSNTQNTTRRFRMRSVENTVCRTENRHCVKRCQLFLDHVSQLMVTIFQLDEISHMGLIDQSVLPAAKLHEKMTSSFSSHTLLRYLEAKNETNQQLRHPSINSTQTR
jgi:hypothetical protein